MRKHILLFLILSGFVITTTSCTSKKVDQAEVDAELSGDAEAAPEGESEDLGELADDFAEDGGSAEAKPEEATETAENAEGGANELDALDSAPSDEAAAAASEDLSLADSNADSSAGTTDTPADTSLDDSSASLSSDETQGLSSDESFSAPKPVVPLQKMISTPYTKSGVVVNALYVARAGDTLESVSQKIYGQDKTEELKSINPTFARRDMKVGDKVYYNSPQRPTDSSTVKTYYEDMGLAPEVYLSQSGDNIRTVAKNLLGHENSWKEIWSTNLDVESKGELTEGTRLQYWSGDSGAPPAPVVAQTDSATEGTPPPAAAAEPPPAPMPDEVVAQAPPPPEPEAPVAMEPPPPPPPPMEMTPPAPPVEGNQLGAIGEDPDQLMALGAGAILLIAAIALFIIIRKKRARRSNIDFQTATHTNIE